MIVASRWRNRVNLTERKLGLVFATWAQPAGSTRFPSRFCVCGFILVRGR